MATSLEILSHVGEALFIQPALLPFFVERIEHKCYRNADEKPPDDAPFASPLAESFELLARIVPT
jgi:hypothetical protein